MRSVLCLIVLFAFMATVIDAQPATVLELISGTADFQVRYRANELPQWFLNGRVYYILGSLPCNFGENPIWNGTDWTCGNFTGFPGGTSLFEQLNCAPGQNIAFNGTTYICANDFDLLANLTCPDGNIPVKAGTTFICGTDSDSLRGVACNQGDILISDGTAFRCSPQTDRDTLRDLNCAEGETVKYINSAWTCAPDLDTFANLNCAAFQVAKFQNGAFVCAADNDFLGTLGCVAGQTLIGDSQFSFRCVPEPRPPGVPISFIDGQSIAPSTTPSTLDTYFGSPQGRILNSIQLANGLTVFALSFNFNKPPRANPQDAAFKFTVNIWKRIGLSSSIVATVDYPATATNTYVLTSLNLDYSNQEQLYVTYDYEQLNFEQGLAVTTVLFVRHYVF